MRVCLASQLKYQMASLSMIAVLISLEMKSLELAHQDPPIMTSFPLTARPPRISVIAFPLGTVASITLAPPSLLSSSTAFCDRFGIIGEEREGPPPCSDRRRLLPPLDCCRSDAPSDKARTSPTSDARRASSRSGRGALPSRGGALPRLQHPCPVVASSSTRGREAAS